MKRLLGSILVCSFTVLALMSQRVDAQLRQPAGPVREAQANGGAAVAQPQMPFPPLTAQHEQYLNQVLAYWEHNSSQIKTYECQFTRWEYDPVFGPGADPRTGIVPAKTIGVGLIKYAEPDKGLFEVAKVYDFTPPKELGKEPTYTERNSEGFEKWICDGASIFEFDFPRKRLVERALPPDMRGKAITEGPLPFLFGAKADTIKQRYWVRIITPKDVKGEYWLEAWPKERDDAANFKKVEVIIAEEDFLPKAIQVYDVNYDPRQNPARTAFSFEKRKVNPIDPLKHFDRLKIFHRDFYVPNTPNGWERVVLKFGEADQPPNSDRTTSRGRVGLQR